MVILGTAATVWLMAGPIKIGRAALSINTMLYASLLVLVGVQLVYFAVFSKVFGVTARLIPSNNLIDKFLRLFTLERGLAIGGLVSAVGIAGFVYVLVIWGEKTFGQLVPSNIMRISIPSVMLTLVGIQTIFASFLLATLTLQRKN